MRRYVGEPAVITMELYQYLSRQELGAYLAMLVNVLKAPCPTFNLHYAAPTFRRRKKAENECGRSKDVKIRDAVPLRCQSL